MHKKYKLAIRKTYKENKKTLFKSKKTTNIDELGN